MAFLYFSVAVLRQMYISHWFFVDFYGHLRNSPVLANRDNTGTVGIQVFAKVLTPKAFQFYHLGGTKV